MIGLSGLARGALPSPYLHRRISMTVMVAQFLGQRHGSQILCVPAGIQIPLQTFQDQLCPACIGKASTPVFFFGINFNFYAAAVSGIRGRTGHNDVILANYGTDSKPGIGFIVRKLRYQIGAPGLFTAHLIKPLIDHGELISFRQGSGSPL